MIKVEIPCIILAGGQSRRMGKDKSLLPFKGFETITEYQIDKFKNSFEKIYISTKNRDKFNFEANFIEDLERYKNSSPLIALLSIFENLKDEYIFILSVDTPFFSISEFNKLFDRIESGIDAVIAKTEEQIHPTCAIYRKTIVPIIKKMIEDDNHKLKFLLNNINTKFIDFENENLFINLNYPKEYERAKKWLNI